MSPQGFVVDHYPFAATLGHVATRSYLPDNCHSNGPILLLFNTQTHYILVLLQILIRTAHPWDTQKPTSSVTQRSVKCRPASTILPGRKFVSERQTRVIENAVKTVQQNSRLPKQPSTYTKTRREIGPNVLNGPRAAYQGFVDWFMGKSPPPPGQETFHQSVETEVAELEDGEGPAPKRQKKAEPTYLLGGGRHQ